MAFDPTKNPELAGLEYLISKTAPETRIAIMAVVLFVIAGVADHALAICLTGAFAFLAFVARNLISRPGRPPLSTLRWDCLTLLFTTFISQLGVSEEVLNASVNFHDILPSFILSLFYDVLKIGTAVLWVVAGGIAIYQRPSRIRDLPIFLLFFVKSTWRLAFVLLLVYSVSAMLSDASYLKHLELFFAASLLFKVIVDTYNPVTFTAHRIPEYRAFEVRKTKWTRMRDSLLTCSVAIIVLMAFDALDEEHRQIWGAVALITLGSVAYYALESRGKTPELITQLFGEGKVGEGLRELSNFKFNPDDDAIQLTSDAVLKTKEGKLNLNSRTMLVPLGEYGNKQQLLVLGDGRLDRKRLAESLNLSKATVVSVKKSHFKKVKKTHQNVPLSIVSPRDFGLKFDDLPALLASLQLNTRNWLDQLAKGLGFIQDDTPLPEASVPMSKLDKIASGRGTTSVQVNRAIPGLQMLKQGNSTIAKAMGFLVYEDKKNSMLRFPGGKLIEFGDTTYLRIGNVIRVLGNKKAKATEIFGQRSTPKTEADARAFAAMPHMEKAALEFEAILAQHLAVGSAMPSSDVLLCLDENANVKVMEQGKHEKLKVLEPPKEFAAQMEALDPKRTPVLYAIFKASQKTALPSGEQLDVQEHVTFDNYDDNEIGHIPVELLDPEEND